MVVRGGELVVAFSGEMNDLEVLRGESGGDAEEELVDACGTLAATHDEEGFAIRVEAETGEGFLAGEATSDRGADGGSGKEAFRLAEEFAGFLEAQEDFASETGGEAVGFSRDGVGFVNEGGDTALAGRKDGGSAGESAHAQDEVGFVFAVEVPAHGSAFPKAAQEADEGRGENRGHRDRGEFVCAEFRMCLEGGGVNGFLGNDEKCLMAAGMEFLPDGEAGEEVAAGASAGNDDA